MRASLLLLGVFGCGGGGAKPAPIDNTGGEDAAHAPCYPDLETVTARRLYEDASADTPGTCTINSVIDERGYESASYVQEILDDRGLVATLDSCGVDVSRPRITDERGITVGDAIDAIVLAYPPSEIEYRAAAGLGGETHLSLHMGGLDLAWFELDGMGPPSGLEGEEAIAALEGQRVASYRAVFMCD